MSSLWDSRELLETKEWEKRRRSLDLAKFFCEPARRNDYDLRQAEAEFIKESGRLGNVYFFEDIQRWAPGDLAGKMAESIEDEDFVIVMRTTDGLRLRDPSFAECSTASCKKRSRRCRKHEKAMRKAKADSDGGPQRITVEDILAATGATLRDFEVRGTPDDDAASHRARLRATEYARIGLLERGFTVVAEAEMAEVAEHGYMTAYRPPGPVTIRLPSPFDDSELIASSTPLGAILKSASPAEEVTKRLRCVEDTLALARRKLSGKEETFDLKRKLADKTMLLDEQARELQKMQKELQKTQKELAELSDSVQRAISGMDQMQPQPTTSQYERGDLHRQLGQRVGAMLRQVESGAKNAKKLDATMQKLRVAEQDLQQNRSRHAKEMEAIKAGKAIIAGEVDAVKATNAVLEARVAELSERNAQPDDLERLVECVVCKDRYVDVVFHCGHTTCSDCAERLRLNDKPCPSCQQQLGYRKKLFLGS
ncbi:hypothetical protein AAVH_06585 [Aphelenchoides avenae]|nr:hypothetical protein AAVH_06585 [Aphelenchus avenae]